MNTTPGEDDMSDDAHKAAKELILANDTLNTLRRVGLGTEVDSLRVKRARERLDAIQEREKEKKASKGARKRK